MARPKGIPHTKEWKEEMSKKMKGKKSHPNSLKALKDNRGDRTGLTAWNKGIIARCLNG